MRSTTRNALLRSIPGHDDHDDDDPSPAGGAMPAPAIPKEDGAANDNAAVVVPLRVAPKGNDAEWSNKTLNIQPVLVAVFGDLTVAVEREIDRLRNGGAPHVVETVRGEIVNVEGAITAGAMTKLGREIIPTEIPEPSNVIEHGWRSYPGDASTFDDDARALAVVRGKAEWLKAGRERMSEAGKRGAAIRHGNAKGQGQASPFRVAQSRARPRLVAKDVVVDILRAFTNHREGEPVPRVADLCSGWGTTICAAVRLGFEAVGIEMEPERYKIAEGDIIERDREFKAGAFDKNGKRKAGK